MVLHMKNNITHILNRKSLPSSLHTIGTLAMLSVAMIAMIAITPCPLHKPTNNPEGFMNSTGAEGAEYMSINKLGIVTLITASMIKMASIAIALQYIDAQEERVKIAQDNKDIQHTPNTTANTGPNQQIQAATATAAEATTTEAISMTGV